MLEDFVPLSISQRLFLALGNCLDLARIAELDVLIILLSRRARFLVCDQLLHELPVSSLVPGYGLLVVGHIVRFVTQSLDISIGINLAGFRLRRRRENSVQ